MTTRFVAFPQGVTLPYGNPTDATLDGLAAKGCKIVRVGYPEIENMLSSPANAGNAGSFSTAALTTLGNRILSRGMDLHFSGLGVPAQVNASAGSANWKYHATNGTGDTQMAGYYGSIAAALQALMDAHPGRTCYLEANQEANIRQYNPGSQTYARIAAETLAIYTAARANSTDVLMVGPSFANRGGIVHTDATDVGHTGPAALATFVAAQAGLKTMFDFLGYHPYAGSTDPHDLTNEYAMGQFIAYMYEAQVTQGMTRHTVGGLLPVCVTEWGMKQYGTESGYRFDETNQADRTAAFIQEVDILRDAGNVDGPEEYYTAQNDQKQLFKSGWGNYDAGTIWQFAGATDVDPPPPTAPSAHFTATPSSGDFPLTVAFTDASTGTITARLWNFGDGTFSYETNPTHTFAHAGDFTVTLTAYNGGASSSRSALIVATTPLQVYPPTPTDLPPDAVGAPTVPTNYYVSQSAMPGNGLDGDRLWSRDENHPRRRGCRAVIFLGGLGGYGYYIGPRAITGQFAPARSYTYEACIQVLNARSGRHDGYTFLGCAPGGQWGNDAALANLDDAIALLQGDDTIWGGAAPGRVALVGESMGVATAMNYAVRNPDAVAGIFGINPAVSLVYHYNGGIDNILEPPGHGGTPTTINQAFGLPTSPNAAVLDETVRLERDPMVLVDQLLTMPMGLTWHLEDTVVDHATVEDFVDAKGGAGAFTILRRIDSGGHSDTQVTGDELLTFLDSCHWP